MRASRNHKGFALGGGDSLADGDLRASRNLGLGKGKTSHTVADGELGASRNRSNRYAQGYE